MVSVVLRAMPDYCRSLEADGGRRAQWAWLSRIQGALSAVVMAATSSRWGAERGQQAQRAGCGAEGAGC